MILIEKNKQADEEIDQLLLQLEFCEKEILFYTKRYNLVAEIFNSRRKSIYIWPIIHLFHQFKEDLALLD